MKNVTYKKFNRVVGSIYDIKIMALHMKIRSYTRMLQNDYPAPAYRQALIDRKFWSEVYERMKELQKTS